MPVTVFRDQHLSSSALHHKRLEPFFTCLTEAIEGECDFSDAGVAMFTSDASNYRQVPLGVVFPKNADDIESVSTLCSEFKLPVLMRGAGTSQNGQTVNEAVILDCSRHMNQVLSIDVNTHSAVVEPGVICDSLKAAAEEYGLTFGPDPATHNRCTLGGMIGNNSCGPRSMLAGKTVENVLELEVLTSDGARFVVGPTSEEELDIIIRGDDRKAQLYRELKEIRDEYAEDIRIRFPDIKRRVSGYNLDQLLPENGFNVARALVGTEGTCVMVLRATVNLITNPACKRLFVVGFADIYTAGDAVPDILPFNPIAMEGLDWGIVGGLIDRKLRQREVSLLPEGKAWLMIEIAAADELDLQTSCLEFKRSLHASEKVLSVKEVLEPAEVTDFWSIREQGASATAISINPEDPDPVVGWEDVAVDPLQLGDYLREFYALVDHFGYKTTMYGHFGDGCIHARITFDTRSKAGVMHWRKFSEEIAALVIKFGGSLSGEHGDGQAKAEFLPLMFGPRLIEGFNRFKKAWDPDLRMNPGKLVNPYRMDENLRYGPDYQSPDVETRLKFADDLSGFGRTTERCIGMGKCRAKHGAMCPSYQVTGEERYSTRGRAHLFHELVRGELISDGWNNRDIANSLEHCLSCKACKSECPTSVDIALWKSEFMAKHYEGRRRPLGHYLIGQIGNHLPTMSRFSTVSNFLLQSPLRNIINKILGIGKDNILPTLAGSSFKTWAAKHCSRADSDFFWFGTRGQHPVILWLDSFNNHYRPDILRSAIKVLTKSDYQVGVASETFCCGRPLYEYGFLDKAKLQLNTALRGFCTHLPADAKVVVLEPSCLSVFRDELLRLFPDNAVASDLCSRTVTIADFLVAENFSPKRTLSSGIVHLHCHHKSLDRTPGEKLLMQRCFDKLTEPEAGCCGMAGSFGLREATAGIAKELYKRKLQPAVHALDSEAVIVTNGFSCAEQFRKNSVEDATTLTIMHPVEVIEHCL